MVRLIRRARAPQTDGVVSTDDVRRAIIDAGRGELLKPPYRHVDWSNEAFLGSQGMFGHQLAGKGVSKPILYAGEVHSFINGWSR